MSKHTPGPWVVDPRAKLRVFAANKATVASAGCTDTERSSWEANARLIAAAPELLEALQLMLDAHLDTSGTDGPLQMAAKDAADAAIAKATGEQA
jgi:hypothetical protein